MALDGIVDSALPLLDVVVAEDELVELQAAAAREASATIPSAAVRVFHDVEPKDPP